MPIDVTCPGCHQRFKVSEKFAGKEGPCPKCKAKIKIPEASEQVVVHAPESFGPKTRSGEAVLKPISRSETRVRPLMWGIIGAIILVILGGTWFLRDPDGGQPWWLLGLGALIVAFPIVRSGYAFLRDDELEPYRGRALWGRVAIVSILYAATWAAVTWLPPLAGFPTLDLVGAGVVLAFIIGLGTAVSYFAFDLEVGTAFFHYAYYLAVTICLRLLMALDPFSIPIETT